MKAALDDSGAPERFMSRDKSRRTKLFLGNLWGFSDPRKGPEISSSPNISASKPKFVNRLGAPKKYPPDVLPPKI